MFAARLDTTMSTNESPCDLNIDNFKLVSHRKKSSSKTPANQTTVFPVRSDCSVIDKYSVIR